MVNGKSRKKNKSIDTNAIKLQALTVFIVLATADRDREIKRERERNICTCKF